MKLISHRGNINGRVNSIENNPNYINIAISRGFDVEVDVWFKDNKLWLGHDNPEYVIDSNWFEDTKTKLWIHCKNVEALLYLKQSNYQLNYFWHQKDDITITSNGYFWTYPGKQLTKYSIACMPEIDSFYNLDIAFGICSDYIDSYKNL